MRSRIVFALTGLGLVLCGCPTTPEETPGLNPNPRVFKSLFRYTAGASPSAAGVADLNGDGLRDLVTANRAGNTVSVLLGDAALGFKAKVDYATGAQPAALVIADLNKDTKLDLITANAASDDVSILYGNGDGTFQAKIAFGLLTGAVPADVILADTNGDTNLDVVVACSGNDTVSILESTGPGAFGLVPRVLGVGEGPRSVIAFDIDKDTVLDLATANRDSNSVSILFGKDDHSFDPATNISVGVFPRAVRAANLDGDGWPDLVTTNPGSGDISIVLSQGNGLFDDEVRLDVPHLPSRFILQDLDNDGALDLGTLLFSEGADGASLGNVVIFKGDGLGGFTNPRYFGAGADAIDLQAVKVDNDNRLDIVTAGGSTVNVLYARAPMVFDTEERFPTGENPRAIAVDDFNRDGKKDLAVSNLNSQDVSVLLGNGDGTFDAENRVEVSGIPLAIATGLLNGDNNPDIVATNLNDNRVSVLLGKGDGTFQSERLVVVRVSGESRSAQPRSVALADMNGDTKLDIVTGNAGTDSVAILLGKGDGTFNAPQKFFAFNYPLSVSVRDFNGDGKLDVAVCNGVDPDASASNPPRVNVIFGKGDGTLDDESRLSYTTGAGPVGMVVGEFTGDSNPDCATLNPGDARVNLLEGRAGGKLLAGSAIRVNLNPNSITAGDLNKDGRPDLVTTNDDEAVSVVLNLGGTSFSVYGDTPVGFNPIGGILNDLNGDTRLDLVVANRATGDISVLLGNPF